jgi:hypothetical protein
MTICGQIWHCAFVYKPTLMTDNVDRLTPYRKVEDSVHAALHIWIVAGSQNLWRVFRAMGLNVEEGGINPWFSYILSFLHGWLCVSPSFCLSVGETPFLAGLWCWCQREGGFWCQCRAQHPPCPGRAHLIPGPLRDRGTTFRNIPCVKKG